MESEARRLWPYLEEIWSHWSRPADPENLTLWTGGFARTLEVSAAASRSMIRSGKCSCCWRVTRVNASTVSMQLKKWIFLNIRKYCIWFLRQSASMMQTSLWHCSQNPESRPPVWQDFNSAGLKLKARGWWQSGVIFAEGFDERNKTARINCGWIGCALSDVYFPRKIC